MDVATPAVPSYFAPPAKMSSSRRHHPTLHMRSGSNFSSQQSAQSYQPSVQPLTPQYSPTSLRSFQQTPSSPTPSQRNLFHGPEKSSLQRQTTGGSANFQNHYSLAITGHRHQTASIPTSNCSINRIASGDSRYPSSTPPTMQSRPSSISPADTYVARLRRAKATVWSARGQREDLNRSNSKDEKYSKKNGKRATTVKVSYLVLSFYRGPNFVEQIGSGGTNEYIRNWATCSSTTISAEIICQ